MKQGKSAKDLQYRSFSGIFAWRKLSKNLSEEQILAGRPDWSWTEAGWLTAESPEVVKITKGPPHPILRNSLINAQELG